MESIVFYTERLIIRQFCEKDTQAYFQLLANPKAHCFVGEKLESIDKARDEIQKKMNLHDDDIFNYIIDMVM